MISRKFSSLRPVVMACAISQTGSADIMPFVEDFDTDASSWFDAPGNAEVDWVSTGGPDGALDAYVTTTFDYSSANEGDPFVVFRGQDEFASSGNAFVGDWIAGGVTEFSFWVRHDATEPVSFFARIASPSNFPAVNAIAFSPVAPNTWTLISFDINPVNPAFIFEGPSSTFSSVFGNVGHLQVGFTTPGGGSTGPVTFDLDGVAIIPSPPAFLMLGGALLAVRRRRRDC